MYDDEKVTITDMEKDKKHLTKIQLNYHDTILLDNDIIYENALHCGLALTVDDVYNLQEKSDFKRAKEKALWLLGFRDYSSNELKKKLRKDYNEVSVDKVIDLLQKLSLINDHNFAKRYATDLINIKQFSGKRLEYELQKKGIDRNIIEEIMQDMPDNTRNNIEDIFLKRVKNNSDDEKTVKRTVAKLRRMGYRFDDIKAVAEELNITLS